MIHSPHFRGYTRAGREMTRGKPDWREQFDIGAERECGWRAGDPAWMRLQGPNQWPRALPELRPALLAWQGAMTEVAIKLLRAFAEALGQSPDVFEPIYRGAPNQHIKIIRYPGRGDASDAAASGQGVGPHKDSGFLSFILQDGVGGLEVEAEEAPGSKRRRARALSSSMSANCWNSPRMDICAPPSIAWSPRRRARAAVGGLLSWGEPRGDDAAPRSAGGIRRRGEGAGSDPDNPLLQHAGARIISKGGCARIPTWRSVITAKSDRRPRVF